MNLIKKYFQYFSIKSKLQILILGVNFITIAVMGYLGWYKNKITVKEDAINHLTSVRSAKAHQIENYFKDINNKVDILAQNQMIIEAMVKFRRGYKKLDRIYIEDQWNQDIQTFYEEEFFPLLAKNSTITPSFEVYQPQRQAEQYLHYNYIANNLYPISEKYKLIDAKNSSEYNDIHTQYHETLVELIEKFRFDDLLFIDYKTGDVVYSVIKETDIGTNLLNGTYQTSNLAEVVRKVQEHPEKGVVQIVDFQEYHPSYGEPVIFMAVPISNGPHEVGILAVQINVDQLNEITTGYEKWKNDGLGKTGETFLIGSDGLMRSVSRFLIEKPTKYRQALRRSGTPQKIIKTG